MKYTDNMGLHLFEGADKPSLSNINANTRMLDAQIPRRIDEATATQRATLGAEQGRYRVLLKEAHSLELGPYTLDPANCLGEHDTLYNRLLAAPGTRFAGEYAYACAGKVAYRLDHRAKKAVVLLDLTSKADTDLDTVVCVDEYHVYFARHVNTGAGNAYNGYLEKYTHDGQLVSSVLSAAEDEWTWDLWYGFSGDSGGYCSMFGGNDRVDVRQTRDYIAVCCETTAQAQETYNRHYMVYSFSKTDLAKVGGWSSRGDAKSAVFAASNDENRLYDSADLYLAYTDLSAPAARTNVYTASSYSLVGAVADFALVSTPSGYKVARFADIGTLPGPVTEYLTTEDLMLTWYDPVNGKFTWYGAEYDPTANAEPVGKVWSLADGWYLPRCCYVDGMYYFLDKNSYDYSGNLYRDIGTYYIIDRLAYAGQV